MKGARLRVGQGAELDSLSLSQAKHWPWRPFPAKGRHEWSSARRCCVACATISRCQPRRDFVRRLLNAKLALLRWRLRCFREALQRGADSGVVHRTGTRVVPRGGKRARVRRALIDGASLAHSPLGRRVIGRNWHGLPHRKNSRPGTRCPSWALRLARRFRAIATCAMVALP